MHYKVLIITVDNNDNGSNVTHMFYWSRFLVNRLHVATLMDHAFSVSVERIARRHPLPQQTLHFSENGSKLIILA